MRCHTAKSGLDGGFFSAGSQVAEPGLDVRFSRALGCLCTTPLSC